MIVSRYSCRGCRQWNTPALAPETHPATDTGRRPARWTTQDSRRPLPPPQFIPLLVGRGLGVQAPGPLAVFCDHPWSLLRSACCQHQGHRVLSVQKALPWA